MINAFHEIEPKEYAPKATKKEVVGTIDMFLLFCNITELFTVTLAKAFSTMLAEETEESYVVNNFDDDFDDDLDDFYV